MAFIGFNLEACHAGMAALIMLSMKQNRSDIRMVLIFSKTDNDGVLPEPKLSMVSYSPPYVLANTTPNSKPITPPISVTMKFSVIMSAISRVLVHPKARRTPISLIRCRMRLCSMVLRFIAGTKSRIRYIAIRIFLSLSGSGLLLLPCSPEAIVRWS